MKRENLYELIGLLIGVLWFGAVTALCIKLICFTVIHIAFKLIAVPFLCAATLFFVVIIVGIIRFIISLIKNK